MPAGNVKNPVTPSCVFWTGPTSTTEYGGEKFGSSTVAMTVKLVDGIGSSKLTDHWPEMNGDARSAAVTTYWVRCARIWSKMFSGLFRVYGDGKNLPAALSTVPEN